MTLSYLLLLSPWQRLQQRTSWQFLLQIVLNQSTQMSKYIKMYYFNRILRLQVYFILFFAGARNQPLVQLQRKSLQLSTNSNYTSLSAVLTIARSQYEIGGFPYLLGQETNSSGQWKSPMLKMVWNFMKSMKEWCCILELAFCWANLERERFTAVRAKLKLSSTLFNYH